MGLATKTIEKHISNVDCFINDYLLYEDAIEAIDGVHHVSMYFEYWIIKKSAWASPNSIKSGAASIKKFYAFMVGKNLVKQEDLDSLAKTIKDEMPTWLSMMKSYDQNIFEMDDDYWSGSVKFKFQSSGFYVK